MALTRQALDEFAAIYKREFGVDLDEQEILILAPQFLNLIKAIYKPIKKKEVYVRSTL